MATNNDKKIYELPDLETVTGDEEFPVSYEGKNYNVNISQVLEYVENEGGAKNISETQIDSLFPEKTTAKAKA